jgi:hypothetical protein
MCPDLGRRLAPLENGKDARGADSEKVGQHVNGNYLAQPTVSATFKAQRK